MFSRITPGRRRVIAAVGVIAALAAIAVEVGTREPATPADDLAASFSLPSVTGTGTVSLADRDGRPAVVNFFASWCAPCKRELPHFAAASRKLGNEVAFLGIAHQDDAGLAAELLAEFDIDYPAGNDPDGKVARLYLLRGMPSTAFVTGEGALLGVAAGELDAAELDGWIDRLVAA